MLRTAHAGELPIEGEVVRSISEELRIFDFAFRIEKGDNGRLVGDERRC